MTEEMELLISEVYFVTPYKELLTIFPNQEILKNLLTEAMQKEWIRQFKLENHDFQEVSTPDLEHVEEYSYLATKKAMLEQHHLVNE